MALLFTMNFLFNIIETLKIRAVALKGTAAAKNNFKNDGGFCTETNLTEDDEFHPQNNKECKEFFNDHSSQHIG